MRASQIVPALYTDGSSVGTIDPAFDASLPDQPNATETGDAVSEAALTSRKWQLDSAAVVREGQSVTNPDKQLQQGMGRCGATVDDSAAQKYLHTR